MGPFDLNFPLPSSRDRMFLQFFLKDIDSKYLYGSIIHIQKKSTNHKFQLSQFSQSEHTLCNHHLEELAFYFLK